MAVIARAEPQRVREDGKEGQGIGAVQRIYYVQSCLYAVCTISEPVWDAKLVVAKGFGWTQEDTMAAFQKAPRFLTISAGSLKRKLKSFVDELSCNPASMFSLEKRVIPRLALIKMLDSKDLCKRKNSFNTILHMKDEEFYMEYVLKDECPDFLEVYSSSTNGDSGA